MKHIEKNAFTIVELVIVIAVVAILSTVLLPTFSSVIEKAIGAYYDHNDRNDRLQELIGSILEIETEEPPVQNSDCFIEVLKGNESTKYSVDQFLSEEKIDEIFKKPVSNERKLELLGQPILEAVTVDDFKEIEQLYSSLVIQGYQPLDSMRDLDKKYYNVYCCYGKNDSGDPIPKFILVPQVIMSSLPIDVIKINYKLKEISENVWDYKEYSKMTYSLYFASNATVQWSNNEFYITELKKQNEDNEDQILIEIEPSEGQFSISFSENISVKFASNATDQSQD